MFRRSITVAAVAGLLVTALAACAPSTPATAPGGAVTQKPVVLGLGAAPANLDFTTTSGAAIPQVLLGNVYEGLVKLDPAGKVVPDLAKSWDVSGDGKTYTFQLQPGVTFSNGAAFDASTVKFNIERVKSSAWTISLKSYMDVVRSVDVVSPTVVRVNLSTRSNDWLFRMTSRIGAMFAPNAVKDLATTAIGTGPYTVAAFTIGQSVVLRRNAAYWGTKPAVPQVTFQYYLDSNAETSALLSGSIDGIVTLSAYDTVSRFQDGTKYVVTRGSTTGKVTLSMNNASGPFTDIRLRKAVEYAIDRKALVKIVTNGYGTVTGSFVPPSDPWYENLSARYPYDPKKAKQLIAAAGYAGKTIQFDVPDLPAQITAAQVIQSDLKQVGLNLSITVQAFPAQWLTTVFTNHDYDMSIITQVEQRDLTTYGDPKYYWGYDSKPVQQLLAAGAAGTPEEQTSDYRQAMSTISDDAVSDWLYLADTVNVVDAGLSGVPKSTVSESFDVSALQWTR